MKCQAVGRASRVVLSMACLLGVPPYPGVVAVAQPRAAAPRPGAGATASAGNLTELAPGEYRIDALPAVLSRPGLYRLERTLAMVDLLAPTKDPVAFGIIVQSDHVTIDLGGHELIGAAYGITGIVAVQIRDTPPIVNLCVRNGTIRQWGTWGIDASVMTGARFADLCILRNGEQADPSGGLLAGAEATLTACEARWNSGVGLRTGDGAQLTRCTGSLNKGSGFVLGRRSSARDCDASANTEIGLIADGAATISGCRAANNGTAGIWAGKSSRVRECDASGGALGIGIDGFSLLCGNHVADNTGAGVALLGTGTRMDSNHVTGKSVAVQLRSDADSHVIVSNTFSGNATKLHLPDSCTTGGLYEAPAPFAPSPAPGSADSAKLPPWVNIVQ